MALNIFSWVLLVLGVLWFLYVFWTQARANGFDTEKALDTAFVLIVLNIGVYSLLNVLLVRLSVFYYQSFVLSFNPELFKLTVLFLSNLLVLKIYSINLSWSPYRLLDLYTEGIFFLGIFVTVSLYVNFRDQSYLFAFIYWVITFLFSKAFATRLKISGVLFSCIGFFCAAFLVYLHPKGYLLISFLFFTIAVLNIFFRRKIIMTNTRLSGDFLELIKKKLLEKDKELAEQEVLIKSEDPYLEPNRAEGNSEMMDEAILEDGKKEIVDARTTIAQNMRAQIKRALSFMKIGKYGVCEICGKDIDKARLEFYPETTKCLDCAQNSSVK